MPPPPWPLPRKPRPPEPWESGVKDTVISYPGEVTRITMNTDGSIVNYEDVYKRDNKVIAALLDSDGENPGNKSAEKVAVK